jgi:arylsulfatase A-like enzyme
MYDDTEIPEEEYDLNRFSSPNYPAPFKRFLKGEGVQYDGGAHTVQNRPDINKIKRAYWGAVTLIDKNIGKMLDCLEKNGLAETPSSFSLPTTANIWVLTG